MAQALPSAATNSAQLSLFVATTTTTTARSSDKMQSESLKKTFRRILPASSSDIDQLDSTSLDPTSSESIGGDTTIGAIEASLGGLKEASALAAKIPYISPVGHLINLVLTIRDASELKQYEKEWDAAKEKFERIAGLLGQVDAFCEKHNRERKDLPPDLCKIFESLESDLDGLERALNQSHEIGRIKKIFSPKSLLKQVKEFDSKLSDVLQIFHCKLRLNDSLEKLSKEPKVTRGSPSTSRLSSSFDIAIPMPQEPCFGRDSELAEIIDMIFRDGPQPARIAILGPGGYGKTTLASAVLTHERVQEHFGHARYFIACESVSSSGALLTELAKTLGLLDGATDVSWPSISMALNTKDCILCFDNFETPWDQDGKTKSSIEELAAREDPVDEALSASTQDSGL
ncbi:P-loop containing nucleoside triphosphate hydrolase protein [Russula compacta]|nr:P-loop containing nucleoside triphosphate hydrolase protein [Russula compacta]